jgi:large subunit ribosomal protein L4
MATAVSYSKTGAKRETSAKLEKAVFAVPANHDLIAQAYRTYLAAGRTAGAVTLKRGDVRGGGRKPWRQKGTGRARVGSIRVPNWKGGGVVFGPTGNENHILTLPVRMKRLAIRQALSLQADAGHVSVIEAFASQDGKVKPTIELLSKMNLEGNILLVIDAQNDLLDRATRNVAGLEVVTAKYLNVFNVMNADHLLFTNSALAIVKDWLGEAK